MSNTSSPSLLPPKSSCMQVHLSTGCFNLGTALFAELRAGNKLSVTVRTLLLFLSGAALTAKLCAGFQRGAAFHTSSGFGCYFDLGAALVAKLRSSRSRG